MLAAMKQDLYFILMSQSYDRNLLQLVVLEPDSLQHCEEVVVATS